MTKPQLLIVVALPTCIVAAGVCAYLKLLRDLEAGHAAFRP
jgi:hypothetical protein